MNNIVSNYYYIAFSLSIHSFSFSHTFHYFHQKDYYFRNSVLAMFFCLSVNLKPKQSKKNFFKNITSGVIIIGQLIIQKFISRISFARH